MRLLITTILVIITIQLFAKESFECNVMVWGMNKQSADLSTPLINYSCYVVVRGETLESTLVLLKEVVNSTRARSETSVDLRISTYNHWGIHIAGDGKGMYLIEDGFELATASNSCKKIEIPEDIISVDPDLEKTVDCQLF